MKHTVLQILAIAALIAACSGCKNVEMRPSDMPDASVDADEHEDSEADAVEDAVDEEDATVPEGLCDEIDRDGCLMRSDCAWNGQSCLSLDGAVELVSVLSGQTPGEAATRGLDGFDDGDYSVTLTAAESTGALQGALTIDGGQDEVVNLIVTADVDRSAGRITLDIFGSECLGDGTDCDNTVHAFRAQGIWDGTQLLFSGAEVGDLDLTDRGFDSSLANMRFQPNDGVKPVEVPERSERFSGPVASTLRSPLPMNATCSVTFTDSDLHAATPVAISCTDGTEISTEGDTRILEDTYAIDSGGDRDQLWFKIATTDGEFTFVARDEFDLLGGMLVIDDGSYWQDDRSPLDTADVDGVDVVSSCVLFAQEVQP